MSLARIQNISHDDDPQMSSHPQRRTTQSPTTQNNAKLYSVCDPLSSVVLPPFLVILAFNEMCTWVYQEIWIRGREGVGVLSHPSPSSPLPSLPLSLEVGPLNPARGSGVAL